MFNKNKNRGFTLIELLVVVTIIGILSGIVVVAVGDATARARDTRRLADARQLAFILEQSSALHGGALLTGCTGAAFASTTLCANTDPARTPNDIGTFFSAPGGMRDPAAAVGAPACAAGVANPCNYSIRSDTTPHGTARTDNYAICFHLETDVPGPLTSGFNSVRTGVRFVAGCL